MTPAIQSITKHDDADTIQDNTVHLRPSQGSIFRDSSIHFHGTGNVLYVEDGAKLRNCRLRFMGDNAVIHIRKSARFTEVISSVFHDSIFYLGEDASFTSPARLVPSERENIIIGRDAMFSSRVSSRTADPHLIYSTTTHKRVNPSRSVWVGDNCWIGEEVLLLKGARIGSGSILGARALVTRQVPSNSSAAGVPSKVVGDNVFWLRPSVHAYTKAQTENSLAYASDDFVFAADDSTLDIDALELALSSATTGLEREEWCQTLDSALGKNRFFICLPE